MNLQLINIIDSWLRLLMTLTVRAIKRNQKAAAIIKPII